MIELLFILCLVLPTEPFGNTEMKYICFQNGTPKTARTLIYLIISLVVYWTGHTKLKRKVQEKAQEWLPQAEILDEIPLRVMWPGDDESFSFQMMTDPSDMGAESSTDSYSHTS